LLLLLVIALSYPTKKERELRNMKIIKEYKITKQMTNYEEIFLIPQNLVKATDVPNPWLGGVSEKKWGKL